MTTTAAVVPGRRGFFGTLRDIYHERTNFDFIGRSWLWALISGTLVVVSIGALAISGLNLGIDFEGGTQWEFRVAQGRRQRERRARRAQRDRRGGCADPDPREQRCQGPGGRAQARSTGCGDGGTRQGREREGVRGLDRRRRPDLG